MLSYLQQCASMHALHKTLFSDVKRQTRWGQVTLLSHLIIKSWPLQHISLHSGTRRKNLTSCNNCIWQLVGREWHREVVLDNICIRPGQLTRWKQKCFPHSAGSCAPAPSCCWMFVNWHSVDSLGTMNHTPLSTLHSQLGTIQDMMSWPGHWPLSPCPRTHVSICSRGQLRV